MKFKGLVINYNIEERAKNAMKEVFEGEKLQHIMINSAPDFFEIQDLYLNSLKDWFNHPLNCSLKNAIK